MSSALSSLALRSHGDGLHASINKEFMMKIQTLITALVLAASGAAFAQTTTATPRLDQRQANQEKRIEQGVASGQLNKREALRLEKREAKLEADKQTVKADGIVTVQERKQLNREASRDSKAVYRQKHDRQVAGVK
ncbi:hypothetical protein [Rhodoferax ferrireducens]|uniref:hypothetical protein n=1 Tax=Rhodoferax ferrireducens TaxID=192843 RepID=UPI0018E4EA50|nr:hypothetical protein [Rhodoferax ferrireducens]